MVKLILKKVSDMVHWTFNTMLSSKQRKFIKNLISTKQKHIIKKLIVHGNRQAFLLEIDELKHRLTSQGFTKKAYDELQTLFTNSQDLFQRKALAWELALWHANQYSQTDARKCLEYLPIALQGEKDKIQIRSIAIIEAECYDLLGEFEKAKRLLSGVMENDHHPDLYLAFANLEKNETKRAEWLNKALNYYDLGNIFLKEPDGTVNAYDRLQVKREKQGLNTTKAKVSIIIPTYNDQEGIQTALSSILTQTWGNLEVLVADDCSTDNTHQVVKQFAAKDSRVKLIKAKENSGAYVARNLALQIATGDFVTINDSDDWSHPEKIEKQALHLLKHPSVIGNTSQQARATEELSFYRRGKPGHYLFSNMSSFMFRRQPVIDKIGYWDSVRFGADSEFIKRIRRVFGERSIVELETGPLSFQRQSTTSLTGNSAFGFPGFFMGARKEYIEAHEYFHDSSLHLKYRFPQDIRPFPIPEPMWPQRGEKLNGRRVFDTIIVSDFREYSGPIELIVKEIEKIQGKGTSIGLFQMYQFDRNPERRISVKIRKRIDGDQIQMLVYGEKLSCDTLLVLHPAILEEHQKYVPDVEVNNLTVIMNEMPVNEDSGKSVQGYNLIQCQQNLKDYFGKHGKWFPLNEKVRRYLSDFHSEDLKSIQLADKNWERDNSY